MPSKKKSSFISDQRKKKIAEIQAGGSLNQIKTSLGKTKISQDSTVTSDDNIDSIKTEEDSSTDQAKTSSFEDTASEKKLDQEQKSDQSSSKTDKLDLDEKIRIELNNIIEYNGHYYRGVQLVSRDLAKELQKLDEQLTIEKQTGNPRHAAINPQVIISGAKE